jgi:hypothetical protein
MSEEIKHQAGHTDGGYEKRDVNVLKVALFGIAGVIMLVVLIVLMLDFFTSSREKLVYESVLKPESITLRELRARETQELESYGVIDAAKGIYRIPIKRAMELMADEAYQARLTKKSGK